MTTPYTARPAHNQMWPDPSKIPPAVLVFPYGYGVHFYRHFMHRTDVPLLLARFSRE